MAKQVEDFSPEERQLILKDAEELGLHVAADKHGTTWQAVCSIRRIAEGRQGMRTTTPEERERIWERAGEVGFAQAAAEYNLKEDTIKGWQWKYDMKEHDVKTSPKKMPKIFTPEERAEIVDHAINFGMNHAMEKYNVSKTAIRNWMKKMGEPLVATPTQQAQEPQQPQQSSLQEPSAQEPSTQMSLPMQESIQESPAQPQEMMNQPQELNDESVNTVGQNAESADTTTSATTVAPAAPAAITDNAESKDDSANKPAPAIEAPIPVDSKASDLIALVQELRTEVAVLKERNAVLSHNLEVLKKAMQELLS